ncbi:MAG: hypothetical protein AVO38_05555 [delta proteobacterium ML8_D]|nr:MAG: hypothetical protein AVO38_05555 [delta proteobacterium ML8_D]
MRITQRESTNAGHRGGLPRSSDEVSVMKAERRGQPVQSKDEGQPGNGRNLQIEAKPFTIPKQAARRINQARRMNPSWFLHWSGA